MTVHFFRFRLSCNVHWIYASMHSWMGRMAMTWYFAMLWFYKQMEFVRNHILIVFLFSTNWPVNGSNSGNSIGPLGEVANASSIRANAIAFENCLWRQIEYHIHAWNKKVYLFLWFKRLHRKQNNWSGMEATILLLDRELQCGRCRTLHVALRYIEQNAVN